jgi:hypothetical protein
MTIQLSGLPVATSAADSDIMLIRQGLVDKQIQVALVRTINLAAFSFLNTQSPNTPQQNDIMLIARGGNNYKLRFAAVGFVAGTRMWFYSATAPAGWTILDNTSGALLAVKGTTYTAPGSIQGTWQQTSHTLTLAQIPSHKHDVDGTGATSGSGNVVRGYRADLNQDLRGWSTALAGGGQGHNHGNTWRPLAHVGILCEKTE